jgi:hypothetical protein
LKQDAGLPFSILESQKIPPVLKGAAAGLIASFPMSIGMNLMFRALPEEEQYPLPPREITLAASERVGLRSLVMDRNRRKIATGAGHFGYGSFGGALYCFISFSSSATPITEGDAVWRFFLGIRLHGMASCTWTFVPCKKTPSWTYNAHYHSPYYIWYKPRSNNEQAEKRRRALAKNVRDPFLP